MVWLRFFFFTIAVSQKLIAELNLIVVWVTFFELGQLLLPPLLFLLALTLLLLCLILCLLAIFLFFDLQVGLLALLPLLLQLLVSGRSLYHHFLRLGNPVNIFDQRLLDFIVAHLPVKVFFCLHSLLFEFFLTL